MGHEVLHENPILVLGLWSVLSEQVAVIKEIHNGRVMRGEIRQA